MSRPRSLSDDRRGGGVGALTDPGGVRPTAEVLAGVPRPRGVTRFWGVLPIAVVAGLLVLRACLHTAPLDRLTSAASAPDDPKGTVAYTGSIDVARGGPLIIGFHSPSIARLAFAGKELRGLGLVKDRIVVPTGPAAIRFVAPPGARLVWSPVGRRGDPEYVPASSLSPEPPDRATFDGAGTAPLDGAIAAGLVVTLMASIGVLARRRLAAVSRNTWIAMAGVLALGLVVRLVGLGDAGQTWDEDVNWAAGRNYVTNLVGLDFSDAAWSWNFEHPPVMKLLDGIGAQLADGFGPARALSALWISLGCALIVPIGTRLYRFRVGVLAAIIAALLPPMIAHGQLVGHESPTVLWWSLGVLLALGVHDYLPSDDRIALRTLQLRLAWVGAVVGVAIASRFVNGLLGPLCAVIVVVQAPARWRKATAVWGAVVMPIVAALVVYALWPRLWGHPFAALAQSLDKLAALHATEPFLGAITNQPGPHYFAVYLFATLPVGVLAGVAAWLVRAGLDRDRRAAILGAWLVIPLAVALSPVRQDGVRYVMPCLAALAVMAAAGYDLIAVRFESVVRRRELDASAVGKLLVGRTALALIGAVIAGYLGLVAARTHPYYLDYFGEQVGGAGAVAERRWFETAWWGEGLDRAVDYVNDHAAPGARIYRECIEPAHLAWFREDLWTPMTKDPREATWIVAYAPMTRPCPLPPGATKVFEVSHDGAVLAAVYQR